MYIDHKKSFFGVQLEGAVKMALWYSGTRLRLQYTQSAAVIIQLKLARCTDSPVSKGIYCVYLISWLPLIVFLSVVGEAFFSILVPSLFDEARLLRELVIISFLHNIT